MKQLGMWNRLAIVLVFAALTIVPLAAVLNYRSDLAEMQQVHYKLCRQVNSGTGKNDLQGYLDRDQRCLDDLVKPIPWPTSDLYWGTLIATAIFCVVFYLSIWAIVATTKWVWRGRQVNKP